MFYALQGRKCQCSPLVASITAPIWTNHRFDYCQKVVSFTKLRCAVNDYCSTNLRLAFWIARSIKSLAIASLRDAELRSAVGTRSG